MQILEILKKCNEQMPSAKTEEEQIKVVEPLGQLIKSFMEEIKLNDGPAYLRLASSRQYSEILKPNTNVGDSDCSLVHFFLDDIKIYKDFMNHIVDYFIFSECTDFSFENLILAIQIFIMKTFGPLCNGNELYGYFCQKEDEHVSIKDLYEKNWAVCIERATFAHNLLKLLGLDDTAILCDLLYEGKETNRFIPEQHVVNIVRNNNEFFVIDFMNCSKDYYYHNNNGKRGLGIKNIKPTIIKFNEQEYEEFLHNKRNAEFDLTERHLDRNIQQTTHYEIQSHALQPQQDVEIKVL